MRRWLFLVLVLVLSLSAASVGFAQEGASADPNACLTGGSMEGQCDFPTAAEDEWAWTCGYYVGLYDNGDIARDQIPDWCYYQEAGEVLAIPTCFTFEVVDFRVVGPINTLHNVVVYNSNDGSCTGMQLVMGTIVQASTPEAAEALCDSLLGDMNATAFSIDQSIIGQPNYWGCNPPA